MIAVPCIVFDAFLDDIASKALVASEVTHYGSIIGEVETQGICEIALAVIPTDLEFPTLGVHVTDVVLRIAVTEDIRNLPGKEHSVGCLIVVVAGEAESVVEHVEIKTDIPGLGGLPGDVPDCIRHLSRCCSRNDVITDIHRGRTEIKGGLPRIVSDSLISEGTVGAPYLEEAENTLVHNSSHERLFRKNPAD